MAAHNPVVTLVDDNGASYTSTNPFPSGGSAATPSIVRIEDGTTSNLVTVSQFHNNDNQAPGGTAYGLLTGGVAQLLNQAGNLDRQRETGIDGAPAVGITTGAASFAMAFLTTDSTDNFAAGTRTFTPVLMSGTMGGVPWSIQVGSVLTLDTGASAESVVVTAVTSTTFTCVTTKAHNGTVTPFQINGFVYNQERDAAGEQDGANGSGTAVAAEYEFNGGGAGSSNYDRARNLQGKGLSAAMSWTGTLTAPITTFTASATPTALGPGQPIYFYTTATGAITEVVYTALNYVAGSTTILLKSATVSNHNSATESFRYDIYAAAGPGLNGFLPTGIGIEEAALYDPASGLFYLERSATQDGASGQNIVLEAPGLFNGTTFDRARAVSGDAMASTGIEAATDMLFNGTTFDRARAVSGDAMAATGIEAATDMLWNGASFDRPRAVSGDAMAATGIEAANDMLWNGASFDRMRSLGSAGDGLGAGLAVQPSSTPVSPAAGSGNTAVSQTYAAVAGQRHRLTLVAGSYSGSASLPSATAAGSVSIVDGSTTVFQQDLIAPGPFQLNLPPGGIQGSVNSALVITLAAGGASVIGKLSTAKLTA